MRRCWRVEEPPYPFLAELVFNLRLIPPLGGLTDLFICVTKLLPRSDLMCAGFPRLATILRIAMMNEHLGNALPPNELLGSLNM